MITPTIILRNTLPDILITDSCCCFVTAAVLMDVMYKKAVETRVVEGFLAMVENSELTVELEDVVRS